MYFKNHLCIHVPCRLLGRGGGNQRYFCFHAPLSSWLFLHRAPYFHADILSCVQINFCRVFFHCSPSVFPNSSLLDDLAEHVRALLQMASAESHVWRPDHVPAVSVALTHQLAGLAALVSAVSSCNVCSLHGAAVVRVCVCVMMNHVDVQKNATSCRFVDGTGMFIFKATNCRRAECQMKVLGDRRLCACVTSHSTCPPRHR